MYPGIRSLLTNGRTLSVQSKIRQGLSFDTTQATLILFGAPWAEEGGRATVVVYGFKIADQT